MNKRCLEILEKIVNNNEMLTVSYFADYYNISKRMIRYDIDTINNFLKQNNVNEIEKKQNSPLRLYINNNEKDYILQKIKELDTSSYILSTYERVGILIYEFLSSEGGYTYNELQKKLCVSKATIVSDMKKVKLWLDKYDIYIIKNSNKGIIIKGEDKNIRTAIKDLLIGSDEYNILELIELIYNNQNDSINIDKIEPNTYVIGYIKECIKEIEKEIGILSEQAFINLISTIYLIINKTNSNYINEQDYSIIELEYKKEFNIVNKIAQDIYMKFGVSINKNDVLYLTTQILSASKDDGSVFYSSDYLQASIIVNEIILKIRESYIPFFDMDNQLLQSFIKHFKTMLFRAKFGIKITNPILESIVKNYKIEFYMIRNILKSIDYKFMQHINEDEIGYITMYICSAIEKEKVINNSKNILIVCSSGFATARLLEHRIKNNFVVNSVHITSLHNIDKYLENDKIDYIISPININKNYKIPIIYIPSIFNDAEFNILKDYLVQKKGSTLDIDMGQMIKIINRYCIIKDEKKLINSLQLYVDFGVVGEDNLKDYIGYNNIQLDIDADNWIDAVKKSALPLIKNNSISPDYVDDIIENVKEYGPYIVIDDGIAMPHAKPNHNVNKFDISITTFKNPVRICDSKDIKVFITIATKNDYSHISFISQIMKLLDNKAFIKTLFTQTDIDAVLKCLKMSTL